MNKIVSLLIIICLSLVSCYNTYYLSDSEFSKLQSATGPEKKTVVTTLKGEKLEVNKSYKLFVTSVGGKKYEITPFNFKMTKSQLVASDRDIILMLNELKDYQVKNLSLPKTIALISAGVAAISGVIIYMVARYGSKKIGTE